MEQADLHPDESVTAAAKWLAANPVRNSALLPEMRTRFGITTLEAIEAIRIANTIRAAEYLGGARNASR